MTYLQNIINLGITSETDPLQQHYIRITNIINLLYIFAVSLPLLISVITFTNDGIDSYARFMLLMMVSMLGIALNALHQNKLAKIITSIAPFLIIIVFPIFYNHFIHTGMFLWIPYAIMALGIVPFFVFSFGREKIMMYSVIAFYLLAILFFDEFLMHHFTDLPDLGFIQKYYYYYINAKIIITIFLYTSFFVFKIIYHKNRIALMALASELEQKNQELHMLNANLENKVSERTAQLTLQNNRIKNLAYTNAHEIRAHIARIIGLSNIFRQPNITKTEYDFCQTKIIENISDLEKVTQKLSKELIEEDQK